MSVSYWGPITWKTLHCITYNYPINPTHQEKKMYNEFFYQILPYLLPCQICQRHYLRNLNSFPLAQKLNRKEDFIRWLIDIHNYINRKNGKPTINYLFANHLYQQTIYINEINQFILFHRRRTQYGQLPIMVYNRLMYFLNLTLLRTIPAVNNGQITSAQII